MQAKQLKEQYDKAKEAYDKEKAEGGSSTSAAAANSNVQTNADGSASVTMRLSVWIPDLIHSIDDAYGQVQKRKRTDSTMVSCQLFKFRCLDVFLITIHTYIHTEFCVVAVRRQEQQKEERQEEQEVR